MNDREDPRSDLERNGEARADAIRRSESGKLKNHDADQR